MTTAAVTLSSVLFAIGVFGVLTRRNAISLLVSVEIMMNAAIINLAAFSRLYEPEAMTGQVFALVGIGIAACEAAVGLALVLAVYRRFGSTDVDSIDLLKG
ncbi:MAG: NADH-quinone oxidoreductase subunit NuoK [Actinobacteria bacterium]|nr:NADH-quinone oxidoreductase subunit NuoK [Actinomycetota bacterium]